jgi:hypothetical protein
MGGDPVGACVRWEIAAGVPGPVLPVRSPISGRWYARFNLAHSIHQILSAKAGECNALWKEASHNIIHPQANPRVVYKGTIQEVWASIELMDDCLREYGQQKRRAFLLKQFWLQLSPALRAFIKIGEERGLGRTYEDIREVFSKVSSA